MIFYLCSYSEKKSEYRPKRSANNNKDEDNSPKTLNDKNQQALSQKFRQLISSTLVCFCKLDVFPVISDFYLCLGRSGNFLDKEMGNKKEKVEKH